MTVRPTPRSGTIGTTLVGALLGVVGAVSGQEPDTLAADTLPRRVVVMDGLRVSVARATATAGGSSAVELDLDSAIIRPAPTLEQVLRTMPLVQIRKNSRGQAQPALRGSEDRQIAILFDGVPLTLGWDHRTDLSVVPLTAARNVRVVRGLSSVLFGPNVLGGVVEIDVARGSGTGAGPPELSLTSSVDHVGGRGVGVSGGTAFQGRRGQWTLRAGAGYQEQPGLVLPDGLGAEEGQRPEFLQDGDDLRLNSDVLRFDGFVAGRYAAEGGSWASLAASGFTSERGVPPEAHIDDPRLWRYPHEDRLIVALGAGTGMRATGSGEGELEASVGIDLGETEIDTFESAAFDEIVGSERGDDRTLTARVSGAHSVGSRGMLRSALTLANVGRDELLNGTDFSEFQQRLWSLGAELERRFDGLFSIPGVRDTRLSAGLVVDGADTPESGDKPPLGTLWDWGARLGLSSVVSDEVRLHASVSRRTRFPALRELYSGALGRFEPNPDLSPEALTGGETGITWNRNGIEVQAVGFHQRLTDGIVRTTVEGEDGINRFKRINRDEIRSTGLELLGHARLGRLDLSGDLTLQDVKAIDEQGDEGDLEYEPSVAGKVQLDALLPLELEATAGVRFVSDQFCENPEAGGLEPFETDPAVEVALRRFFELGGGGTLSRVDAMLALENVTDAAVFDQCGLPQQGRTLRLQLRLW